jgi:predicted kinase
MDLLSLLSNGVGFISLGVTLVLAFFAVKSGKMQSANTAQGSTIAAMKEEMEILDRRVADGERRVAEAERKNDRLELTIETMCEALKLHGLTITIQGNMIHIQDANGTTSTRMHSTKNEKDA